MEGRSIIFRWIGLFVLTVAALFWVEFAQAAPTLVQKKTGSSQDSASVAATFDAAPTSGNLLIAIAANRQTSTPATPAGWSVAIDQSNFAPGGVIYYKIAGASEPTTVTVNGYNATNQRLSLQLFEYSGVDTLDQVNTASGNGTAVSSGSVTTTGANELVIAGVASTSSTSYSAWSNSFAEQQDFVVGGFGTQITAGSADFSAISTGTYSTTATAGGSGNWRGVIASFSLGGGGVTLSGRVFEDANFSGTASDWDGGTNDLGLNSVDVELYDNSNNYLSSTTTVTNGGFPGYFEFTGLPNGTYKVRVRSATVGDSDTAPKGTFNACVPATCANPLSEMTWGNGAALYGGQSATVDDTATGDNAGPGDTYLSVTVSGANVSNINFGFAYNLIVNKDDDSNAVAVRSKQGSLRQFLKNANAIGIAGSTTANASQFRIPAGLLVGGVAQINVASALPTIDDTSGGTILDGQTQITNIGDTNSGNPVVVIDGSIPASAVGLTLTTNSNQIKKLTIQNFKGAGAAPGSGIVLNTNASSNTLSDNIVKGNQQYGIYFSGTNNSNTISNNTLDSNSVDGLYVLNSNSNTILSNTFKSNGIRGIRLSGSDFNTVSNNTAELNSSHGIALYLGSSDNIVSGNISRSNSTIGIQVLDTGTTNNSFIQNVVYINTGDGIRIAGTAAGDINRFYHNTVHGNSDGFSVESGTVIVKNSLITGNSGWGFNKIGGTLTEAYNDVTDASTAPANSLGRVSSGSLDATDLNANPLYTNSGSGDFTLQASSPAINRGCNLGAAGDDTTCDAAADGAQPDINGASAGNFNGYAPDLGAYESSVTNICPVSTVSDGTAPIPWGSLRDCLTYANANPGTTVSFSISLPTNQATWWRITVTGAALPTITAAGTLLDGATQRTTISNANGAHPEIEVAMNSFAGLQINNVANVTIRELVINGASGAGVTITGAGATGNSLFGNYIGTNATGSAAAAPANGAQGVLITTGASSNDVGGPNAGEGNLISGNTTHGVQVSGANSNNNRIRGNIIGMDANGTTKIANGSRGVQLNAAPGSGNQVGGASAGEGNLISGNASHGIQINIDEAGAIVKGNKIGTDINGAGSSGTTGNSSSGVRIDCNDPTCNETIGGIASGEGNLIAYNGIDGITIIDPGAANGSGNTIRGNIIRNNVAAGINGSTSGILIVKNEIRSNGSTQDGITLINANAKLYHNTLHGNGGDGIELGASATGATIKNNLITGHGGYGINRLAASWSSESNNDITDAATTPANASGRSNVALDASDLNANPLYVNAAGGDFTLTECSSPAINAGVDLGADQPDMNGGGSGNYNGAAPDMGSLESSCGAILSLVKQVWQVGGSAPLAKTNGAPTSTTVPSGQTIVFLIYVKNPNATALGDIRFSDLLDVSASGFDYVAGSLVRDDGSLSDAATDLQIFNATAPGTGTALNDAVDGDVGSVCDSGAGACPGTTLDRVTVGNTTGLTPAQANGTLSIAANKTFAIRFRAVKK